MTQGIQDKIIVITGASSELGEAAARRLARDGAKLVLGARRLDKLQALARELSLGDNSAVQTDVTDPAQVRHLVEQAVQMRGRVDVIINNALLDDTPRLPRDWDAVKRTDAKTMYNYGQPNLPTAPSHFEPSRHHSARCTAADLTVPRPQLPSRAGRFFLPSDPSWKLPAIVPECCVSHLWVR